MAAEKKPRAVVVKRGIFDPDCYGLVFRVSQWGERIQVLETAAARRAIGQRGALLWLPDPPKQTKRGKR